MLMAAFSSYLARLEKTSSRNEMTVILAQLLSKAKLEETDKICYLALGRLGPKFATKEFNLAEKMMMRAVGRAFGVGKKRVAGDFKKIGDLGKVAFRLASDGRLITESTEDKSLRDPVTSRVNHKLAKLNSSISQKVQRKTRVLASGLSVIRGMSVIQVYDRLQEIATEAGEGSVERKIEKMAKLLRELDELSAKYVVRITLEKLRLGFSDMTILDALSWVISGDKSWREEIEAAYNVRADVGQIARECKAQSAKLKATVKSVKRREEKLREYFYSFKPVLGTPVVPALCQRLPNAEEMVKKMSRTGGKVAVEPKYDGIRLQLHVASGTKNAHQQGGRAKRKTKNVNIFTRNLDNVTEMFPDIVEALKKEVKAREVILDGEAVGFDPKTGRLLPFQETIKRKRKYQIQEMLMKIPLKYFVFDILDKDGGVCLGKPFRERRKILEKTLEKENKTIVLSPQIVTDEPRVIRNYHDEQIKRGLEGVVLKKLEAPYEPGRRGYTWVKFKSEKKGKRGGGLMDTLDCVVMGYYRGKGKRAGFGIGAFLAGIKRNLKFKTKNEKLKTKYQEEKKARSGDFEGYVTVSKIGTGLSDEQWKELKVRSQKFRLRQACLPARQGYGGQVKVKERPKEYLVDKNLFPDVWCRPGIVVEIEADNITKSPIHTAGYALRFPRLIRFRDDKDAEQVTTLEEVERLYGMQK